MGSECFQNCNLSSVALEVVTLGVRAFRGCPLSSVELRVAEVGDLAFAECPIRTLQLQTEIIRKAAFEACKLSRLFLPEGLRELGTGAFKACTSLEQLHLPSSLLRSACFKNFDLSR